MDPRFDDKFKALQAAHSRGVIVGLNDIAGVAPRLDIDVLMRDNSKAFNLFMIAFDRLQKDPRKDLMGFFQIAGIHGYPRELWLDIPGRHGRDGDPGYCAHGTTLFPTWHRPYLAMLEQALFIKMINLANEYKEPLRSQYREAVVKFRLPYYDYYRPRGGQVEFPGVLLNRRTTYKYNFSVPFVFTAPTITVFVAPDDKPQVLNPNPLNFHAFNDVTGQLDERTEWLKVYNNSRTLPRNRTVRHPLPNSEDNPGRLNSIVNELRMDSARLAVTLVTHPDYGNYDIFSQSVQGRRRPRADDGNRGGSNAPLLEQIVYGFSGSLEAIHNMYHVFLGGFGNSNQTQGHIGFVPCAAFDPLFWFHHGNIERMFTIWQAVHANDPKAWFNVGPRDADQPLLPFLRRPKSAGNVAADFWTSNLAKSSRTFGYYYEDAGDKVKDFSGAQVAQNFKNLYQWAIPATPSDPIRDPPPNMVPYDVRTSKFFPNQPENIVPPVTAQVNLLAKAPAIGINPALKARAVQLAPAHTQSVQAASATKKFAWDWYIDDEVEALAMNNVFTITYFVVADPAVGLDPNQDFAVAPELVGVTHIFTSPVETCPECAQKAKDKATVRNTMFITSQLIDYIKIGSLQSLDPEHVVPFLKARLRWRVLSAAGAVIDPRQLARDNQLKIGVSSRKSVVGDESVAPEYARYPEIVEAVIATASPQAGHVG